MKRFIWIVFCSLQIVLVYAEDATFRNDLSHLTIESDIPKTIIIPLTLPVGAKPLEMMWIPAGSFRMGTQEYEQDRGFDEELHEVTISKPFYIGKYEVTQAQWVSVMETNPSYFQGDNHPVDSVSWTDCQEFIQKINQYEFGEFFLLTESQWEYAYRAGTETRFYWGDDPYYSEILDYAWSIQNNELNGSKEVGLKIPNTYGLYDMSGNIWEWCQDWYGEHHPRDEVDPVNETPSTSHIFRGGSFNCNVSYCRAADRGYYYGKPNYRESHVGFRLARIASSLSIPTPTSTPTMNPIQTHTPTPIGTPQTLTIDLSGLPNGAKPLEMVWIPAGSFRMGSPESELDREINEGPEHQVTLRTPYYLGKYEVTVGQYAAFLNETRQDSGVYWDVDQTPLVKIDNFYELSNNKFGQSWDQPMVLVTWYGAALFCNYLSAKNGLTPVYQESNWSENWEANGYRLPTEAEWEYACRAGTTSRFYWGDDLQYEGNERYAWYDKNSNLTTHPVGLKLPNDWGLYDMSGNVWEWCQDWYGTYSSEPQVDPIHLQSGTYRVSRSCYWGDTEHHCRSANRGGNEPYGPSTYQGFRVALPLNEIIPESTDTPIPSPTATATVPAKLDYFFDKNQNNVIDDEEIVLIINYYALQISLPEIACPSGSVFYFFDSNQNNLIDEEEIDILIQFWVTSSQLPVAQCPEIMPTATNTIIPSNTPSPTRTSTPIPTATHAPTATPTNPLASQTITIPIPGLPDNAKPLEMVLIIPGTFTMGSPDEEQDRFPEEGPQHEITLSEPFYMGKYEITQSQWQAIMDNNPSLFSPGENQPVECVSWEDCQVFIGNLNSLGLGDFRLPTEAEWEYTCRAGKTTRFYWGDDANYTQIGQFAWYGDNSGMNTHVVSMKTPNAWGLFDMSGNVSEWCQDWYGSYSADSQINPTGPKTGSTRILRGGNWGNEAKLCRSAFRSSSSPDNRYDYNIGFRLVRSYP